MPHLSVVVPAYNEEQRIQPTLEQLNTYYGAQPYPFDVQIVSDGSKDGTAEAVRAFCAAHPHFELVEYQPNRGKGYAVRTGMLRARGDWILFCDADLATPPEETDKLLSRLRDGAAVAIGSRPLADSRLEKRQPLFREMMGRAFNLAVQTLAIRGIDDTQCGFKVFTRDACQDIFRRCKLDGFGFDFESLMIARDLGYRVDEVPIRWSHQEGSKVVLMRDGPRMLRDLVKLRLAGKAARLLVNPSLNP